MEIIVYRTRTSEDVTDGEMWIDGKKICDTAEATPYNLEKGIYEIVTRFIKRFGRRMPIIKDTDGMLMMGNGAYSLRDSSIIVGKQLSHVPGVTTRSNQYFESVYERIRKEIDQKNKVILIIK